MVYFRLALKRCKEIRDEVATASSLETFRSCVNHLRDMFEPYHTGQKVWHNEDAEQTDYNLSLPPWICQPYIRRPPEEHKEYLAKCQQQAAERTDVEYFDENGKKISKNVMKRLKRASQKQNNERIRHRRTHAFDLCTATKCANPTVDDLYNIHCWRNELINFIFCFYLGFEMWSQNVPTMLSRQMPYRECGVYWT